MELIELLQQMIKESNDPAEWEDTRGKSAVAGWYKKWEKKIRESIEKEANEEGFIAGKLGNWKSYDEWRACEKEHLEALEEKDTESLKKEYEEKFGKLGRNSTDNKCIVIKESYDGGNEERYVGDDIWDFFAPHLEKHDEPIINQRQVDKIIDSMRARELLERFVEKLENEVYFKGDKTTNTLIAVFADVFRPLMHKVLDEFLESLDTYTVYKDL